ncbi:MAG TPA: hypothetical protein PLZ69_00930 [Candidatus Pacearchaeota archaeon]|nr:hypothetical protein [Candidatus Pacearchaeota archaeon]
MKNNLEKIILVSITGKDENACIEKINELNNLGIKEIGLFLTLLDKRQRKDVYSNLLQSKIKNIPLVHIRHDMTKDELILLKENFKTKYFTIHEINFLRNDVLKWIDFYENLTLEMNFDNFVSKKVKVEEIRGFCVDLAHFKVGMEMLNKDFDYVYNKKDVPKYFVCNHLNGWNPETNRDMHTVNSLEYFDYLKTMPVFLFGKCIAIELFNPIKEQLEFKKYLVSLLSERLKK